MLSCCYNQLPVQELSLFQKILPTIVGSSIVVILFILGRFLDSTLRLRELKRNWYMKVIIDPNIDKLEEFYKQTLISTKESINNLTGIKDELSFSNYIGAKSVEMGKFQFIKRKFEIEFIALVQTNYPEISNELEVLLRDLEDKITTCFDSDQLNNEYYTLLELGISSTKYDLIKILSD